MATPDRSNQNIHWLDTPEALHAKSRGYSLDLAFVGRDQVRLFQDGGHVYAEQRHERCRTYILRATQRGMLAVEGAVRVGPEDLIVVGPNVYGIVV
jgi:hypothetical protein